MAGNLGSVVQSVRRWSCGQAAVCASVSNDAEAIRTAIRKHFADGGEAAFTLEQLLVRFDQFFAESEELVAAVATALGAEDYAGLATAVERSQELTTTHLQNQARQPPNHIPLAHFLSDHLESIWISPLGPWHCHPAQALRVMVAGRWTRPCTWQRRQRAAAPLPPRPSALGSAARSGRWCATRTCRASSRSGARTTQRPSPDPPVLPPPPPPSPGPGRGLCLP